MKNSETLLIVLYIDLSQRLDIVGHTMEERVTGLMFALSLSP